MDNRIKWSAVGAAVMAIPGGTLAVLNFMAEKSPEEYQAAYAKWAPTLRAIAPYFRWLFVLLVMALVFFIARSIGFKAGVAHQKAIAPVNAVSAYQAVGPIAQAKPETKSEPVLVARDGTTVQDWDLAIREVMTALAETGDCRDNDFKRYADVLRRDHPASYNDEVLKIRRSFLKAADEAHAAREMVGSVYPRTGDYPNKSLREKHVQTVKSLGDMFRTILANHYAEVSTPKKA